VLDTHAWVWIVEGREHLAPQAVELVETAAGEGLTPSIAAGSSRLPGDFHGDPADRIIVATARTVGGALVTRDERIREYAAAGYLKTVAI
jgi:PIN domain nuclease of toxin-antitoxin system